MKMDFINTTRILWATTRMSDTWSVTSLRVQNRPQMWPGWKEFVPLRSATTAQMWRFTQFLFVDRTTVTEQSWFCHEFQTTAGGQRFPYKYIIHWVTLKRNVLVLSGSDTLHIVWLVRPTGGGTDWDVRGGRLKTFKIVCLWELQLGAIRRLTATSGPGPRAAWRPAPSSAGLGPAGGPPGLSSGLRWTDGNIF